MKVSLVEVKHIDLPQDMQRAIAKQAGAERERRAKVINAEGEFQAAQRVVDAARIIEQPPAALHLRYLQTLAEVARGITRLRCSRCRPTCFHLSGRKAKFNRSRRAYFLMNRY